MHRRASQLIPLLGILLLLGSAPRAGADALIDMPQFLRTLDIQNCDRYPYGVWHPKEEVIHQFKVDL